MSKLVVMPGMKPSTPVSRNAAPTASAAICTGAQRAVVARPCCCVAIVSPFLCGRRHRTKSAGHPQFVAGPLVDGWRPVRLSAVSERTLVLIKPDGIKRRLVGEILGRIESKGLSIAALELKDVGDDLARRHYAEHEGKPFFPSLLEFITSGPVVAAIVEGPRAVAAFRQIAGATDPVEKAAPGTIRGDLALITQDNLVHGSDSPESAAREIELWFPGG